MRYKFFPGSELSPPYLLGGIVDLDRPQHLVANVFLEGEDQISVRPVNTLQDDLLEELEAFAEEIPIHEFKRVAIGDIMHYTTRRRAMC